MTPQSPVNRRTFIGGLGLIGLAGGAAAARRLLPGGDTPTVHAQTGPHGDQVPMTHNMVEGDVDPATNGFDPTAMLTDFDYGKVSTLPSGQTLREYTFIAGERLIEIAPGVTFPAWTYNGRVPGPTIRCTQGDRLRITFTNGTSHPHSIHFHGIHSPVMDGMTPVQPGGTFVYEFDAEPFGMHLYHCHTIPFRRHIHKGLYGAFIIDPPTPRPPAKELVMVMNAFDTNFDTENEFYAVNTVAFHYAKHPIQVKLGELVRVYLANITEFDPVNSFHLHAGMFNLYRTGTRLEPSDYTDIVTMGQGERHILEFSFKFPGQYMFHAHQSEFSELGWLGIFEASESGTAAAEFEQATVAGICDLSPRTGGMA
jgi:FtsP/CotA-like multicopper oxidase with cupredoxin domain